MLRTFCLIPAFLAVLPPGLTAGADGCPGLTPSSAKERATTLRAEIRHHDDRYYRKLQPAISDAQYDILLAELLRLEMCFPALATPDSPTATVGSGAPPALQRTGTAGIDDSGSETLALRHERPMQSLSSSTGPAAVEALLHRLASGGISPRMLVQPKIDGLPVELIYLSGRLISAATRGNGSYGADVTARVRRIPGIPLQLNASSPARVVVRGEIYADLALMAAASDGSSGAYATSRHFAAGNLRSQDPEQRALSALRLFPFELIDAGELGITSDLAALARLAEWGFPVRKDFTWQAETLDQIRALYQGCRASRGQYPFAADGIVVKLDDLAGRRQLGEGARAPFWAAAWKFPPMSATTLVRSIRWQVGRTGRRTPVAELDPVTLGGLRVSHVSLQNAETLERLGVATGDRVVIALVGDVIPQVQEVIKESRGDAVDRRTQQIAPGPDACLSDVPGCREQFLARAAYFVSKDGLNIQGLGRGRLRKLVEAGLVPDLPSLFRLKTPEIAGVTGFNTVSARRLVAAIGRAGHPEPFRLVRAIGVPGVGPAASRRLAAQFASLAALLADGEGGNEDGAAGKIRIFFATEGGAELLAGLRRLGML